MGNKKKFFKGMKREGLIDGWTGSGVYQKMLQADYFKVL